MLIQTEAIVRNACKAKLECVHGDLANHVGCAYEMWEMRVKSEHNAALLRDVLTELHQLGFKW